MVLLVEPSPLQPLHLLLNVPEHGRHPVDYAVEVGLQLVDVFVVAIRLEILEFCDPRASPTAILAAMRFRRRVSVSTDVLAGL